MKQKILIWLLGFFLLSSFVIAGITDIFEEKQTEQYGDYVLNVLYIGRNQVKFRLNNMTSGLLEEHDLYRFEDGSSIYVREIIENEALEGPDIVSFRFYPAKIPIITEPEIMQNITEQELPSIIPEENITEEINITEMEEINVTKPVENITVPEKIEKPSLLEIIINWIKGLFRK